MQKAYNNFNKNTFSLQKGPCWNFEVNNAGKQTIFQLLSEVDSLASLGEALNVPHGFSQVNHTAESTTVAGRFPR